MSMPIGPNNSGPLTRDNRLDSPFAQGDNSGSLTFPTAHEVENLHRNADTNKRPEAMHHTLGTGHNQAAFGDHGHDITSSGNPMFPNGAYVVVNDNAGNPAPPTVIPSFDFIQNLDTPQGLKDAVEQIINVLGTLGANDKTSQNNGIAPFLTHGIYVNKVLTGTAAVTWGATQQLSSVLTVNFSPVFPAIPRLFLTCRSSSATLQYLAQQTALSATSFDVRVWTTAANTSGNSVPVDWLAILTGTYT